MGTDSRKRVVYLIGAGASQGCVSRANSKYGLLMTHLGQPLIERLRSLIAKEFAGNPALTDLANAVLTEETDFEHIITFLDDSPSRVHRQFADKMRIAFQEVLNERLSSIHDELGEDPVNLYAALLDMYQIGGCPEELQGLLTLNYDQYIETAVQQVIGQPVDFGFRVEGSGYGTSPVKLLKLHGSFGWQDSWPTNAGYGDNPLWIPPGIQKAKQAYPFNVLWGLAREMLSCDVLRIIGCKLGPNDWDLVSLLFTTLHVSDRYSPYKIELIDSPSNAARLKKEFPYLEVQSILEVERVGREIVGVLTSGAPRNFDELPANLQNWLTDPSSPNRNWFELWLIQMAEALHEDLDSIRTKAGLFEQLL